jgi:molybdate transport repressor ModE-like protein
MRVDPHRLLVLRAVLRAGGVQPAARALFLSPSAVSQHLTRLEAETGLRLVDRAQRGGGRNLVLTAAGHALAAEGDRVADALAAAERVVTALRGERSGAVRIGGFATGLRRLVGPAVVDLAIAEPAVVPMVTEVGERTGLAQLQAGEIDLLILERRPDAPVPRGVATVDLLRDVYRVVVPAGWPYSDDQGVLRRPWISGSPGSPARAALESLGRASGAQPEIRHVCDEFASMLALVGAGLGAAVVTDLVLDLLPVRGVRLLAQPLDAGSRLVYVAHRRGPSELGPAAAAALDALRAHAREVRASRLS